MAESPVCVLLINDDLFFSARLLSILHKQGYVTETAMSREQALEKAAQTAPALAILNLGSIRLGGVETVRRLKAIRPALPVVTFLSHVKIPAVRAEVLAAGASKLCANSAITLRLPDIVREALSGQGATATDGEEELEG